MKCNERGFSLLEMLTVLAIATIVMSMAVLQFNSWNVKANIDTQTRELLSDLSDARLGAIQTKGSRAVFLSVSSATFYTYSTNETVSLSTGRFMFKRYFKNHVRVMQSSGTLTSQCSNIGFDSLGMTDTFSLSGFVTGETIVAQPTGTNAAIDCLTIATTKINVGKYNGTSCQFQ